MFICNNRDTYRFANLDFRCRVMYFPQAFPSSQTKNASLKSQPRTKIKCCTQPIRQKMPVKTPRSKTIVPAVVSRLPVKSMAVLSFSATSFLGLISLQRNPLQTSRTWFHRPTRTASPPLMLHERSTPRTTPTDALLLYRPVSRRRERRRRGRMVLPLTRACRQWQSIATIARRRRRTVAAVAV